MGYTLGPADAPAVRMMLLAALIDGDASAAFDLSRGLLDDGVPFEELVNDLIGPVQVEIGRRWADGDLSVADEHASTAATESLVMLLTGALAPANGPTIVIACPENDTHSLAGRVVAATLALRGFRPLFLGASLPAAELGAFIEQQQPLALALSVAMGSALYSATFSIAAAHAQGTPVLVGGRALGADGRRARALGADGFAGNPTEAAELLDHWIVLPPESLALDAPVHPECAVLDRRGAQLVATAFDGLSANHAPAAQQVDELARLVRVLQGALILADATILSDYVTALCAADRAHGMAPDVVADSIRRLADAMADDLPAGRALLLDTLAEIPGSSPE